MIRVSTYKALTGRVPVPSCRVRNFLLSARGLCLGASDDLQLSFETHVQEETDWTEYLGTLPLSMTEDGQLVSSQTGGFIEEPRKQPADKLKINHTVLHLEVKINGRCLKVDAETLAAAEAS